MSDRQPCPIHKPGPCYGNCPNSPEAHVKRALDERDEKVRADERERIAREIEETAAEHKEGDEAEGCTSLFCRGWLLGQDHAARIARGQS